MDRIGSERRVPFEKVVTDRAEEKEYSGDGEYQLGMQGKLSSL
jgi:hypothetical protein